MLYVTWVSLIAVVASIGDRYRMGQESILCGYRNMFVMVCVLWNNGLCSAMCFGLLFTLLINRLKGWKFIW